MKGKKHSTKQVAGGHGPKQGDGHLFGAKGGVVGPGAHEHKGGSHRTHKQKTGMPGKHT